MAFRTQKISQMTPKGSDLEATDLIEVSTIESGSYVTRSITGQELIDAIPAPTGFVPETRTLTINGTTQDLSANRTFTVSTGITIGTTAITSGTVGRVLFEGTGNVVQESANLTWDNTNSRLALNGTLGKLMFPSPEISFGSRFNGIHFTDSTYATSYGYLSLSSGFGEFRMFAASSYFPTFYSNGAERMRIFTTGNIGINTTTDAGFRLDVNGTARVATSLEVAGATGVTLGGGASALAYSGNVLNIGNSASWTDIRLFAGGVQKFSQTSTLSTISNTTINLSTATVQLAGVNALTYSGTDIRIGSVAAGFNSLSMYVAGSERARIASTGNVLINTTTDAGFKLDVNGTAIVRDTLSISNQGRISWGGGFLNIFADSSNGLSLHTPFGRVLSCTQTTGNVLIGTTTDVASSLLTMQSTTKGFLKPRLTTTQKNAIASPAAGLEVYDTTLNRPCFYDGTTWITL